MPPSGQDGFAFIDLPEEVAKQSRELRQLCELFNQLVKHGVFRRFRYDHPLPAAHHEFLHAFFELIHAAKLQERSIDMPWFAHQVVKICKGYVAVMMEADHPPIQAVAGRHNRGSSSNNNSNNNDNKDTYAIRLSQQIPLLTARLQKLQSEIQQMQGVPLVWSCMNILSWFMCFLTPLITICIFSLFTTGWPGVRSVLVGTTLDRLQNLELWSQVPGVVKVALVDYLKLGVDSAVTHLEKKTSTSMVEVPYAGMTVQCRYMPAHQRDWLNGETPMLIEGCERLVETGKVNSRDLARVREMYLRQNIPVPVRLGPSQVVDVLAQRQAKSMLVSMLQGFAIAFMPVMTKVMMSRTTRGMQSGFLKLIFHMDDLVRVGRSRWLAPLAWFCDWVGWHSDPFEGVGLVDGILFVWDLNKGRKLKRTLQQLAALPGDASIRCKYVQSAPGRKPIFPAVDLLTAEQDFGTYTRGAPIDEGWMVIPMETFSTAVEQLELSLN